MLLFAFLMTYYIFDVCFLLNVSNTGCGRIILLPILMYVFNSRASSLWMRILIGHLSSDIATTWISALIKEPWTSVVASHGGPILLGSSNFLQCVSKIIIVSTFLEVVIVYILRILVLLRPTNHFPGLMLFLLLFLLFR